MLKYIFILFLFLLPIFIFAAEYVDINSATLQELDKIVGIGPKYAQAIIDSRPYSSVDDLLKVKGIGEKTLAKIKEQGLACADCTEPQRTETPSTSVPEPKSPVIYPDKIFINKILPSPEGPDETEEFIELFNSNNFEVDLSGWQIKDSVGTVTNFIIPQSTKILSNNYLVFKRPETKIMLNNDGDSVSLISPDGKTKDSIIFQKASLGQAFGPGAPALVLAKTLPKTKKSDKLSDINVKDLTANISSPEIVGSPSSHNPWLLFFITVIIATISASAVLFIKLKFKTNVRT